VNPLAQVKHENSKGSSALAEMEEDKNIIVVETSQVKEDQKQFYQEKRKPADVEKTFDKTYLRAISINEAANKINVSTYILMMGFGASLILDSIIISALNGVGLFSSILALLGVASLVSILKISPQSKIVKNAAKNLQYQILYNGFVNQLDVLKKPDICVTEKSADDVERVSLRLEQITFNTVDKIENLNTR